VKQVLLTILGVDPKPAEYARGEERQMARLAPVALFGLLPPAKRPDIVVALCTVQARLKTLPELEAALTGKAEVLSADIPSGAAAQDVDHFLSVMVAACERHAESTVTVDVTHGYRHFSFLMYTGALYLAALGRVTIDAIYYALLNPQPQVSPFFDLTPLLELPRWVHALETLRETGSAKVVAKLLRGPAATTGTDGKAVAEIMDRVSDAHGAGLPIELGREVGRFFAHKEESFRKMLGSDHRLPLAEGVADQLHSLLVAYQLNGTGSSKSSKKTLVLDKEELKRQAVLIADLLDKGNIPAALGLMNEWTVSWALWSRNETVEWLDFHRHRRKAAGLLGALDAVGRDASLRASINEQQQRLGDYWGHLGSLRNALHHHGMRPQVLLDVEFNGKVEQVRRYWDEELRGLPAIPLECGSRRYRHLLVSPIGERPGVLFSAIKRASGQGLHPDFCLVICSQRSETAVPDALSRAGFHGEHRSLRLEDPYAGKDERRKLIEESRQYLASADDVSVNITGGTTLMGVVAEDLAQEARKLARPARRFALIDRRDPEEQRRDPFVEGDILWLDDEGSNGDY
jgi:hypothetical protein